MHLAHTVSGNDIVQSLTTPALYAPDRAQLLERMSRDLHAGDVVLCFTVSGYLDIAGDLARAVTQSDQTL